MGILSTLFPSLKGNKEKKTFKEKLDMYDMMVANLVAGNSIIEPDVVLDNSKLSIGYSNIATESTLTKYFLIVNFPDYLTQKLYYVLRLATLEKGVKMDFTVYNIPHRIKWDSAEMRSRMRIWNEYTQEVDSTSKNVFTYRNNRDKNLASARLKWSTKYLNEADLDQKRTTMQSTFLVTIRCGREDESLANMSITLKNFKNYCERVGIQYKELRVNLMDWVQQLNIFSLREIKELKNRVPKKLLTDDLLAHFNSYKQGRVGKQGIPLGLDIFSYSIVLHKFKEDPSAAENWLISAATGGGKSFFVKNMLMYLMADDFIITVLDYEGDEYTSFAYYLASSNPEDVKIISIGNKGSSYFDPLPIGDLTGDKDIDIDLKNSATQATMAMFRIIVHGTKGQFTRDEEKVLSTAIRRVYDSVGAVDEDMNTWKRSADLTIQDVYLELKDIVEEREFVDYSSGSPLHTAATTIVNSASIYFEIGESKYGTFAKPLKVSELYDAKFILFSFGAKGAVASTLDPTILALKQLSVANISIQISNHAKYVKHKFNVKVWEEFQRWGEIEGSKEIIVNAITGGRKRGDVNLIITNDLGQLLSNEQTMSSLQSNIQNYAIGRIPEAQTRELFCDKFSKQDLRNSLDNIGTASIGMAEGVGFQQNKWRFAFCVIKENGERAIVKAIVPQSVIKSGIFNTKVEKE